MKPRLHHYGFAHKVIPQLFEENEASLIHNLRLGGIQHLTELWDFTGTVLGKPQPVPSDGLAIQVRDFPNETTLAVITFPTPSGITEAWFGAILHRSADDQMFPLPGIKRYVTLELAAPKDNQPATALCEWASDGTHINYGAGPEPTLEAFLPAALKVLGCQ